MENNQDPGDVRLFIGNRKTGKHDFIIVGQNGREVALKTVIRLIYAAKFADDKIKQKYRDKIESFNKSLTVWMSSTSARQEFFAFFNKYGISNPDVVMIGFRRDTQSLMKDEGITDPKSISDESLSVDWYNDANGKKVLSVGINKNRIFASRSGELINAIFAMSPRSLSSVIFFGSGGAIDAREMVGKIVAPTRVVNEDACTPHPHDGILVHMIRNRAADEAASKAADVSVESVIVETTTWVKEMKARGLKTVDQELFHIINAINSSAYARKLDLYIGTLVTDNVSSDVHDTGLTLEHAEEIISQTAGRRREFLANVLRKIGVLKNNLERMPRHG